MKGDYYIDDRSLAEGVTQALWDMSDEEFQKHIDELRRKESAEQND